MSSSQVATRSSAASPGGFMRQHLLKGNFDIVYKAIQDIAKSSSRNDMPTLFHYLVQECAKVKRQNAAAWCIVAMMEFGLQPARLLFNVAMDTCAKVGDLKLATKLWEQMVASRIRPNAVSYNTMINACKQAGDGPRAEDWIQRKSSAGFPLCIVSFSSVIAAFAKVGKYAKAEEWYEKANALGIDADVVIYNTLIHACAQSGCPDRAKHWFTKMLVAGIAADDTTYNSLINASAKTGDVKTAEYWMNEMVSSKTTLSTVTFGSVLHACAKAVDVDRAEYWMDAMMHVHLTPNIVCFNSVLHACAQKGDYAKALRWFGMMSNFGVQPSRISYNFIIGAYSRAGELASAEAWLNRMVTIGFHADTPCYISLVRALRQLDGDNTFNPHQRRESSTAEPSSLQAHFLIIKAYAGARKLDLIRRHTKQEIANIGMAQRIGSIFREELKEICLASGGLHFASAVLEVFGIPMVDCSTNSSVKASSRLFARPPGAFNLSKVPTVQDESIMHYPEPIRSAKSVPLEVPAEENSFACATTRSYTSFDKGLPSDQESSSSSSSDSELDEMLTMVSRFEPTTPNYLGDYNIGSAFSNDDFYSSAMCFSL